MKNCRECNIGLIYPNNWYKSHNEYNNKICKSCFNKQTTKNNKKIEYRIKNVNKRFEIKKIIIEKYGGKCECCGIDDIKLLSIDHVNGSGNLHRKKLQLSAGNQFYMWLKNNNYPDGFRVLCYNCNCSLGHCKYCPHKFNKDRDIKRSQKNQIGYCRICVSKLDNQNQYKHHIENGRNICKKCHQQNESNRLFELKKRLFAKYGGKCVDCNEAHIEFLTIDHINNDGAKDRKSGKIGSSFYRWIIKNNYPKQYQALCYNCNSYKEYYVRRNIGVST